LSDSDVFNETKHRAVSLRQLSFLLPDDATQSRGLMSSCGICPTVTFVYCVEMAKDTAIVAISVEQETVPKVSNGTTYNDLERP